MMSHNILEHEGMFSRDGDAAVFALIVFACDLIHVARFKRFKIK